MNSIHTVLVKDKEPKELMHYQNRHIVETIWIVQSLCHSNAVVLQQQKDRKAINSLFLFAKSVSL